jgi:polar amino acid transport system substrate-binding protein/glutamate/aspartate transport system substrate-binding protein
MRPVLVLITTLLLTICAAAQAATLDRVKESNTFRIGYRADAPPFAFKDALGAPAGYAVELCRRVAANVKSALELPDMKVEYVEVSADNRFDMVEQAKIDILCGPTSVTLSRRERVDFSLPTFIDGASVLFREGGPDSFEGLAGEKVGVRSGTTTQEALVHTLEGLRIDAEVVPVQTHQDGLARLEAGDISAYFADRAILAQLLRGSAAPEKLKLSGRYFTHEPYALALTRGDSDFRLLVDRTLSDTYRSGDIDAIFVSAFGGSAVPTDILKVMYLISTLPY